MGGERMGAISSVGAYDHTRPNILLIMTDDVGFSASSTFGGSVPTPNLDRLANRGLLYNRFHTVGICSPTRASLLTGRNHHAVGMGTLVDIPSPYQGYTGRMPPSSVSIARILRDNGYNTAMFGKDHNIPGEQRSAAGPFDLWPTGRGFEYFYGFISGDTDQWRPALYEGITPVSNEDRQDGYLLDEELADRAINWIHNQKASAQDKPFFIYYAPGSAHAPNQASPERIARFKGKFDYGWDRERELILARQKALGIVPEDTRLAPRPDEIPLWETLTPEQKKVYARMMEIYAAQLSYLDDQLGRILDELERMGIAENTLVMFIQGDNGAPAGGGPDGTLNEMGSLDEMAVLSTGEHGIDMAWLADSLDYLGGDETYIGLQAGWAFALNTPFPWFKQLSSHLGAVRNGLVVSWPEAIPATGDIRSQYHHVIDIMPTLLEIVGIQAPLSVDGVVQEPLHGVSMTYSFTDPEAMSQRQTQYYEVQGNRGIYHQGWLANTTPRNMPWNMPRALGSDTSTYVWELYNLDEDFSQSTNLANLYPEKLTELKAVFAAEADKYQVNPIHDEGGRARGMKMASHHPRETRTIFTYWGKDIQVSPRSAPPIFTHPFTLDASVDIPEEGGDGVILAAGSRFGGWSFYLKEGKPVAYVSVSGLPFKGAQSRVASDVALSAGTRQLRFDFTPAGEGGALEISVDGERVAKGEIALRPRISAGNGETFDTGRDTNVPVSPDYDREGIFNGNIQKIEIHINSPK